ncbi:hypothetical protein PHET_09621 [Paragonimus heterotremus]|uniref:Uncharacterized protein n=1 Tax=Paragonimus heterotremus TaxID=100268 RepID=A0A8J4WU55_9TREM|nr:hypothetical protein PHET_09621 [Paragonimus heterotremus]
MTVIRVRVKQLVFVLALCIGISVVLYLRIIRLHKSVIHWGQLFNPLGFTTRKEVPLSLLKPRVIIVEEHHEVIPYWMETVKAYNGQKAKLVHVDAHSDMYYPEIVENFPLGKLPENDKETSTMMQANDVFIQSAIVGQLLHTVYVVYPPWSHSDSFAGRRTLGLTKGSNEVKLCMCPNQNNDGCATWTADSPVHETVINTDQCEKRWDFNYLELNHSFAPGVLHSSKKWSIVNVDEASSMSPLILDIDEDYFGVHLASRNLTETGLNPMVIQQLSEIISEIFCPTHSHLEKAIDLWFQEFISVTGESCSKPRNDSNCYQQVNRFLSETLFEANTDWLCHENVGIFIHILVNIITHPLITQRQLSVLSRVGLCLSSAWTTHRFQPRMQLCTGTNTPEFTLVEEFLPNGNYFHSLLSNLTTVLIALPQKPAVITVCRSARDGYTPRWMQQTIEYAILGLLKRVFRLADEQFVYSDQLAGGRSGWNQRYTL